MRRRGLTTLVGLQEDILHNRTAFGAILRKERSARVLFEDASYLAFRNIKPYAPLAALVIPKRHLSQDPDGLDAHHLNMVCRMKAIGEDIVRSEHPEALSSRDFWLKFHRKPYISVDHLHLHVVAPFSRISRWDTIARFCDPERACDVEEVIGRLRTDR